MGLLDKLKNSYDYFKVDKYTKRRVSQSQFESHDRRYYETAYRDGDYLDPSQTGENNAQPTNRSHFQYKQSRWTLNDMLKKSNRKSLTVAQAQLKTSESYTLGHT